jgi:hypothetical protein
VPAAVDDVNRIDYVAEIALFRQELRHYLRNLDCTSRGVQRLYAGTTEVMKDLMGRAMGYRP